MHSTLSAESVLNDSYSSVEVNGHRLFGVDNVVFLVGTWLNFLDCVRIFGEHNSGVLRFLNEVLVSFLYTSRAKSQGFCHLLQRSLDDMFCNMLDWFHDVLHCSLQLFSHFFQDPYDRVGLRGKTDN